MTTTRALTERQARLIAESQALRENLTSYSSAAETRIASIDTGLLAIGRWARKPAVIGIAVMIAVALGPRRSLKAATAGLGLIPATWRIYSALSRATTKTPRRC